MPEKYLRLSERLLAVVGFIEKGSCVADIGTDHGYLPVYLAQNGLARRIIASDISAGSLRAALKAAEKYSVVDKISFVVAPGLTGISETEIDTVVISGLGGETISQILAESPRIKQDGFRLILQPQTKIDRLCSWLRDNGYVIQDAKLARDSGRFYVILLVGATAADESGIRNAGCEITDLPTPEIELFSILMKKNDPLFVDYIDNIISRMRRIEDSKAAAGRKSGELKEERGKLEELEMYKLQYI